MNRLFYSPIPLCAKHVVVVQPTHIFTFSSMDQNAHKKTTGQLLGLSLKLHYFSRPATVPGDYMAVDKHTAINHHAED